MSASLEIGAAEIMDARQRRGTETTTEPAPGRLLTHFLCQGYCTINQAHYPRTCGPNALPHPTGSLQLGDNVGITRQGTVQAAGSSHQMMPTLSTKEDVDL
jgi:hypothetical protein